MNPIHPGCDRSSHKHSRNRSGSQRYECPDCGKRWTPKLKVAMTAAERKRKQRAKTVEMEDKQNGA